MKNIFKFIFTITLTFSFIIKMSADCESDKENAEKIDYYYLNVNNGSDLEIKEIFTNVDKNLYFVVNNDYNNTPVTYSNEDNEEVIIIDSLDKYTNINYIVKVYSKDETCNDEALKTIEFTTSKINLYALNPICNDKHENVPYCDYFYEIENMSLDEFVSKVNNYKENNNEELTFLSLLKKYYYFGIIPIIIGLIIFFIKVTRFKRRNKNA